MVTEKKILLLGSNAVGKTTTFKSFLGELLDVSYRPTLSVNIGYKVYDHNGKQVGLRIWDLGGQLLHREVWRNYYNNTAGCLLLYDITRKKTFNDIIDWRRDMRQFIKGNVPIVLVGNKCDLESNREVKYDAGKILQKRIRAIAFFETSALLNINIKEVIETLMNKMF
jgi:small GTP-binding protein